MEQESQEAIPVPLPQEEGARRPRGAGDPGGALCPAPPRRRSKEAKRSRSPRRRSPSHSPKREEQVG